MRALLLSLILLTIGSAYGQTNLSTESVLHNFCTQANCPDGDTPMAGLTEDASGNFYGTASYGGSHTGTCPSPSGCGLIFKLDKSGNYSVLYNFCSQTSCADGETPQAGLTIDASGNLYGTTLYGGTHRIDPNANGGGTVFKVDSAGNYTVLYSFCSQANCADGYLTYAGVIADAFGNLYGTTTSGGAYGYGTVFKLNSAGTYSVLHNFCSQANCADGGIPEAGLIVDASGNLYGTAYAGGAESAGTVYKLDSTGNFTVLYAFCSATNCADGGQPLTSLIKDASGNLYGTTSLSGGGYGDGTVFKLDSGGNYSVLHSFCTQGNCKDGGSPRSLIEDAAGNFYGTTSGGGALPGAGTVFRLDSMGDYSNVYYFCSQANCTDGYVPIIAPPIPAGNLIEDASGNLYGTTSMGGAGISNYVGVIFKLSPPIIPSPNFTAAASATTVTIGSPGQQGTTTISITPAGGFSQTITFGAASCSGLPTGASCIFSPSNVTPNGSAVSTTLTIGTTATSSAITHLPFIHKQPMLLAFLLPGLGIFLPTSRRKRWSLRSIWGLLLLFGISSIGLCGCGGGSASGGGSAGGGTPTGTYQVTVAATAPNLTHTITLTLVVN